MASWVSVPHALTLKLPPPGLREKGTLAGSVCPGSEHTRAKEMTSLGGVLQDVAQHLCFRKSPVVMTGGEAGKQILRGKPSPSSKNFGGSIWSRGWGLGAQAVGYVSVPIDNQYSLRETGCAFATRPVNSQARACSGGPTTGRSLDTDADSS